MSTRELISLHPLGWEEVWCTGYVPRPLSETDLASHQDTVPPWATCVNGQSFVFLNETASTEYLELA